MTSKLPNSRTLHLIDLENLCGEPLVSERTALEAIAAYRNEVAIGPLDQVIVATARINVFAGFAAWPQARHLCRDGKDGADICLAQVIVDEHVAERFDTVVLASGDGGLADFMAHLRGAGVRSIVVAPARSLSRRMWRAADEVHTLALAA